MEEKKLLLKKKCECGRKVIIEREKSRDEDFNGFFCQSCKSLGVEESRIQFLQTNAKGKTIYK